MRDVLSPNLKLAGMSRDGTTLSTNISSSEAPFINGFFAKKQVATEPVATDAAATTPSPTPFVLPGMTLGIFPVGLVITSVWALLFMGAVGFGTLGRIRFRDSYRRRKTVPFLGRAAYER
jgi:hypothetical protein